MAVIGIDLGTTNSLAAYWKDGSVHLIPNSTGEYLTPSIVSYSREEQKLVAGTPAKGRLLSHSEDTRTSFKRFMGTEKTFYLGNRHYTARELSAVVLKKIKQDAEAYLGEEIQEAIVTVPAYFNDKQRSDTKKAAQLAGLCVKRLINEPSAAALAYSFNTQKEEMTILVFDFGGGTLDLSLVECFDNVVEIVGVVGDNHLGGDDIDFCIAQWFCTKQGWKYDQLDSRQQQLLLKKCELAKRKFTEKKEVQIEINEKHETLTDEILFEICMPLFLRIKTLFLRVLKDCRYSVSDIDEIIMTGGSSKLPILQTFLTELLGKEPLVSKEPDTVIAAGAGVYAGIRERNADIRDMVLTDVCPFTLGIDIMHALDDKTLYLLPIIERNATLPAKRFTTLVNAWDYQSEMKIHIYQGEKYRADENLLLGELSIAISPRPVGQSKVTLCFMYDLNGILQVEAMNEAGQKKKLLLSNSDLTEEELANMMQDMPPLMQTEEQQFQIQQQKNRIKSYYEQAVLTEREQMFLFISWYEREIDSGKQYRIRHAIKEMENYLEQLELYMNQLDAILFNGALKYQSEEEDGEETI